MSHPTALRLWEDEFGAVIELRSPSEAVLFAGPLPSLVQAMRGGALQASDVPLLALTDALLSRARAAASAAAAEGLQIHEEWLPHLARVVALKAKLLLPPETPEEDFTPDDWDDPSEDEPEDDLSALLKLEEAVQFLQRQREKRRGLLPAAPAPKPAMPRTRGKSSQKQGLGALLKAAKNAVRVAEVPLMAREGLSLREALIRLLAHASGKKRFSLREVSGGDWPSETRYFAALLEGLKNGELQAEQREPYGKIDIQSKPPSES